MLKGGRGETYRWVGRLIRTGPTSLLGLPVRCTPALPTNEAGNRGNAGGKEDDRAALCVWHWAKLGSVARRPA